MIRFCNHLAFTYDVVFDLFYRARGWLCAEFTESVAFNDLCVYGSKPLRHYRVTGTC
jgi:hydrogenase maturation factor